MTSLSADVTLVHDANAANFITSIQTKLKKYGHRFIDLTFDSLSKTFTLLNSKDIAKSALQQLFDRISVRENNEGWTAVVVYKTDKLGNRQFYLTKNIFDRWCTTINAACCDAPSKMYKLIDESTKRLMEPDMTESPWR